jgi:hypothetical protein
MDIGREIRVIQVEETSREAETVEVRKVEAAVGEEEREGVE